MFQLYGGGQHHEQGFHERNLRTLYSHMQAPILGRPEDTLVESNTTYQAYIPIQSTNIPKWMTNPGDDT